MFRRALVILMATLLLIGGLALTGCKSVEAVVAIDAPPQTVWDVLVDTEQYPEWNPTFARAEGTLREGQSVTYTFQEPSGNSYEITGSVKKIDPPHLINQGGGVPGIITFDHRYELTETETGTEARIREDYAGLYVWFWDPGEVGAAYVALLKALKRRVEEGQ